MANLCSGLLNLPHCPLWIWFVTIHSLVNLLCVRAKCLGVDNLPVTIYPTGTVLVRYGEALEIFCADETSSAENLDFFLGRDIIPSEVVNVTTRRLYIEKPQKQLTTFSCKNIKTSNKNCFTRVLVDSSPVDVTDFACRSQNLEVLNCTWTSPYNNNSSLTYYLTFLLHGNPVEPCDVIRVGKNMHYCTWTTYSQPRYRQMENEFYFNLTTCNTFGCNTQFITIDHFSIVKLNPPRNIISLYNYTHSVLLQWNIDMNMDLLPDGVDHKIEYQIAKIDNMTNFRSVDASSLPPRNMTNKFLLSDLPYAHMQYEVRIYIKCKGALNGGLWSDFAYKFIYTTSERPKRPPDTIVGSFGQALYNTKRLIYIYWKQLAEYEEAGTNFTYKIVATPHKKNHQTLIADKNKSLSYVILDNAPLHAIDVSIWSMNDNGSSINSSYLYIPAEVDTRQKVTSFTKLAYENGTYKLSWGGVQNIDNYTVFWCIHNTTGICAGRMEFTVLGPLKTTYVIDLPKENRYQFAISANSGKKTSGMVWASCDISKDTIQLYGFPVKMDHDVAGPSYVLIKWTMDCTLQDGVITGYQISYCPVRATSDDCATKYLKINISDPKQMSHNVTGLEPYTTYSFMLAINTTYGLRNIENVSTGVTTVEDTPTSPVNITITDITYNSIVISWYPPIHKNGIIRKYVINNDGKVFKTDPVSDKDIVEKRELKLLDLNGYTNYSWTVQACNTGIRSCSKLNPNDTIYMRTSIGPPGKLKSPTVKSRPDIVMWEPPEIPRGIVNSYQLMRIKDGSGHSEIFNTPNLSFSLVHCDGEVSGETYKVRAINYDEDENYGSWSDSMNVILPHRNDNKLLEYPGEWSDASAVACGGKDGLMMIIIIVIVLGILFFMYFSIKCYKKYRKMEDIKPVLPNGLGVPEKDISKYAFGGWNPSNKDEKPSSDEMLLLPNSKTTISTTESKQKENDNCASSDHTDSTALSDTSRSPADRQISTSDDGSDSSLHMEVETAQVQDKNTNQEYEDSSSSDTEASRDASPYISENPFKKNAPSGYVQQPVNPVSGYVQSAPMAVQSSPPNPAAQNSSSSYVMASLSTPIFTTGVPQPNAMNHAPVSSGYVRPEDAQMNALNFPKVGPSPTKMFGPESLPTMPTLPSPSKLGANSSYIQLQSLDTLPSHKQHVRNTVPLKPQASSGYVSPGDAVINKHFNNMLSGGQLAEESAILDPTMSPDAYCRFSWSTDPASDNLHSLLADATRINPSNN